jgi:hypothetical protein
MNFLKTIILCTILASCTSKNDKQFAMFASLHNGKDIILVSCIKCDCMIEELNLINQQKPELLAPYDIYIDSACKHSLSKTIKTVHINQASIDTLSVDLYNALIIKKRGSTFTTKMVETKDAQKMPKMLVD